MKHSLFAFTSKTLCLASLLEALHCHGGPASEQPVAPFPLAVKFSSKYHLLCCPLCFEGGGVHRVTTILERHLETSVLPTCLQNTALGTKLSIRLIIAVALIPCALLSGNWWRKSASALQCPDSYVLAQA